VLGDAITDWAWGSYTAGVQTTDLAVGAGVWVQFEGGDPAFPVWKDGFSSDGSVDYVQLNTERTEGSTEVGMLAWNTEDETPEVVVGNGEVTLQIGQESHTRVSNNTGATIPNGTVVYLSGGADEHGHPHASPYLADGTISPFRVEGVTTQDILDGTEGLVTTQGKIRGLDTSAYIEGDVLFASTTERGGFQTGLATPPDDIVKLATVVLSDDTAGEILVNVIPLINQLQTNLVFFPTTVAADVSGYFKLVNSTTDSDYNLDAVAVPIPSSGSLNSGTEILVGRLIADANEFVGNPGDVEMEITGDIAKTFGNASTSSVFYYRVYRRTSEGAETLLGESAKVGPPSEAAPLGPTQFSAQANVVFETFSNTDRLVIKFYADVIENGNQRYTFTYGGLSPVRALLPVPVNVVSTPPATDVTVDPTNFNNNLSSSDTTVQLALETLDDIEIPLSPNYLLNGAFEIWQRGTSFSADGYCADRWYFEETGSCTVTQVTTDLPTGFNYGVQAVASTASDSADLYQALESSVVIPLRGKTVTFSCYLKMDSNMRSQAGAFDLVVDYSTTTDARASQTTAIGSLTLDKSLYAAWTRASITFTVPFNAVGLMVGIEPPLTVSPTVATYFVTGAMLELGSVATQFRRNSPNPQAELAACQRYYYRKVSEVTSGLFAFGMVSGTATVSQFPMIHPVPMRAIPVFESSAASTFQSDDGGAFRVGTSFTQYATISNSHSAFIGINYTTGLTTNRPARLWANASTAAYIGFDAEL
jgi:hypothetical protein